MNVTVLYFAGLCDKTNCREERFELGEEAVLRNLQKKILARHSDLEEMAPRVRWAINETYAVNPDTPLSQGDQIALIPPVSGG